MECIQANENITYSKNPNIGMHGLTEIFPTASIREHENSVDALCANPTNEVNFATGSHDRTIKIWDASKQKCTGTLKGHELGVWSCVYDSAGKRLLTASPDMSARLWDTKTGKQCGILKGHTLFCYKAIFDSDGQNVATVGADKVVNYWDLRNTQAPVFSLGDNNNCLMNCDFLPNDQQIVTTSIGGEVAIYSVKRQQRVFYHDTMPGIKARYEAERAPLQSKYDAGVDGSENIQEDKKVVEKKKVKPQKGGFVENKENDDKVEFSNIMYTVRTVKNCEAEEGVILVGAEDSNVTKYKFGYGDVQLVDIFKGHSSGIRSIELNKDCTKMLTGCEDHSLRVWDYATFKPESILSGHRDVVTGGIFLNANTYVTSSWDMTVKFWKI